MQQAVHGVTAAHEARADAGADRDVADALGVAARPPAVLGDRRRADIGVQRDRNAESLAQRGPDRGSRPVGLGGGVEHLSPAGRVLVELERSECSDPDRTWPRARGLTEELEDALD